MNREAQHDWLQTNQRYLMACLAKVREALQAYARSESQPVEEGRSDAQRAAPPQQTDEGSPPPALDRLCSRFGLSSFERDVLLLCAAADLDSNFATLIAEAQGDSRCQAPTFSLALAALPDAHWTALTPSGPLRRWRLIEVGAGPTLTQSTLRIDERVLHFMTGVQHLDERLAGLMEPLPPAQPLVASHEQLAGSIVAAWLANDDQSRLPVIQLCGPSPGDKRAIAAAVSAEFGLALHSIRNSVLPTAATELDALIRLWQREVALNPSALLLEVGEAASRDQPHADAFEHFVATMRSPLLISSRERQPLRHPSISLDVAQPRTEEQRNLWRAALFPIAAELNGHVDVLVSHFHFNGPTIHAACAEALSKTTRTKDESVDAAEFKAALWHSCRVQARPRLEGLARRVEPIATWKDLVLPAALIDTLQSIAVQVRQRLKVHEAWGFAAKSARGLGISALFAGPSGTGKTMAAEVLANELKLDLYHIDLSTVVSKYIGETEKNLRRIFDAAEESGAILLFDEADALFGKRSEVKDSHDRYANIETSYLLQRMEAYRGLAILTTNMKQALDTAFLRRIRFVIQFPFPNATQRAEIWRRVFPVNTPTDGLDVERLTRLNVAGGNIHNIALNAAFLAADDGQSVSMSHLMRAAQSEYQKLEKPLTDTEIRGWI